MWHRPLLLLALIGCAPTLVVAKSYTSLASDYQVGLGVAFGLGAIQRSNVNLTITPVFESGNRYEYERALASFKADIAKTQIDRGRTVFSLLLAPLEMPEEYLQNFIPVGWVGPFGIWAPSNLPADLVREVEQALVRMNGTTLSRFQKDGLPLTTGGAADMRAKARAAQETTSETTRQSPDQQAVVRRVVNGQTVYYNAKGEVVPEPAAPAGTVVPQVKSAAPKEVSREPPPPRYLDASGTHYIDSVGAWPKITGSSENETKGSSATDANKPQVSIADYADKAKQGLNELKAAKDEVKATYDDAAEWMATGRVTHESDASVARAKRREFVDAQMARDDAVVDKGFKKNTDGWVVLTIQNNTPVAMSVVIHLVKATVGTKDAKGTRTARLNRNETKEVAVFRCYQPPDDGWEVEDAHLTCEALPSEYRVEETE